MFILWPLLYHHLLFHFSAPLTLATSLILSQFTGPHHTTSLLKCVFVTLFHYSTERDTELSLIGSKLHLQLKRIHYPRKERTANTRQILSERNGITSGTLQHNRNLYQERETELSFKIGTHEPSSTTTLWYSFEKMFNFLRKARNSQLIGVTVPHEVQDLTWQDKLLQKWGV